MRFFFLDLRPEVGLLDHMVFGASLGGSGGKESTCHVGDPGSIPGLGRFRWRRKWQPTPVFLPGESREMATHPSVLAWRIPWTEEPGGLQSLGLQRVGHDSATFTFTLLFNTFSFLKTLHAVFHNSIFILIMH